MLAERLQSDKLCFHWSLTFPPTSPGCLGIMGISYDSGKSSWSRTSSFPKPLFQIALSACPTRLCQSYREESSGLMRHKADEQLPACGRRQDEPRLGLEKSLWVCLHTAHFLQSQRAWGGRSDPTCLVVATESFLAISAGEILEAQ